MGINMCNARDHCDSIDYTDREQSLEEEISVLEIRLAKLKSKRDAIKSLQSISASQSRQNAVQHEKRRVESSKQRFSHQAVESKDAMSEMNVLSEMSSGAFDDHLQERISILETFLDKRSARENGAGTYVNKAFVKHVNQPDSKKKSFGGMQIPGGEIGELEYSEMSDDSSVEKYCNGGMSAEYYHTMDSESRGDLDDSALSSEGYMEKGYVEQGRLKALWDLPSESLSVNELPSGWPDFTQGEGAKQSYNIYGVDFHMSPRETKKQRLAKELLDTEHAYLHHLRIMLNNFLIPLRQRGYIKPEDDLAEMEHIVADLINGSTWMIHSLIDAETVQDVFLMPKMTDYFSAHTMYVDIYDLWQSFILYMRKNPVSAEFIQGCGQADQYFFTPLQRPPRYLALISDMRTCADSTHPKFDDLSKALEVVELLVKYTNTESKPKESKSALGKKNSTV